jgi:thiol-disulfide isomerase/thioredoxin
MNPVLTNPGNVMKHPIVFLLSLVLFLGHLAHSQSDSAAFFIKIVNQSRETVHFHILDQKDSSVEAGREIGFRQKVFSGYFPFYFSLYIGEPSPDSKGKVLCILSDSISREIRISQTGSIFFASDHSEKLLEYYNDHKTEANFQALSDSIVDSNPDDIVSAGIIEIGYCQYGIETNDILARYNKLSKNVKESLAGKNISKYIEGRTRLQEEKIFADFSLEDSSHSMISLSGTKSKYVLLDFWFSRCGPCIASFPDLTKLYQRTDRGQFQVIGLSVDGRNQADLWKSTLAALHLPWINLHDMDYKVCNEYSVGTFPTKILLDQDRRIIKIDPSISDLEKILHL